MSHLDAGTPRAHGGQATPLSVFSTGDRRTLVRLPSQVVVAAATADTDPAARLARCLAGLAAIAAGRQSDSDLVRAVVCAIYAESPYASPHRHRPPGSAPRVYGLAGAATDPRTVVGCCRLAARLLAGATDPADSAAYRQWVQSVAAKVCAADRAMGFQATEPMGVDPTGGFVRRLGEALGLR